MLTYTVVGTFFLKSKLGFTPFLTKVLYDVLVYILYCGLVLAIHISRLFVTYFTFMEKWLGLGWDRVGLKTIFSVFKYLKCF